MPDLILEMRLDALKRNLGRVKSCETCFKGFKEKSSYIRMNKLINILKKTILDESVKLGKRVDSIIENLDNDTKNNNELWNQYREVYEDSQEVFLECIDFFGGQAILEKRLNVEVEISEIIDEFTKSCKRNQGRTSDYKEQMLKANIYDHFAEWAEWNLAPEVLDSQLAQVAEKLISIVAGLDEDQLFAVPAHTITLKNTLSRIIRMRFPDWDIWTLPLTAHEYGHVLVDDKKWLIKDDKWLHEMNITKKQYFFLHEFLADAFAVYTMGPAYACSTILLRLNPWEVHECETRLNDVCRANFILLVMEEIDKLNDKAYNFNAIIKKLHELWDETPSKNIDCYRSVDMKDLEWAIRVILSQLEFDRHASEQANEILKRIDEEQKEDSVKCGMLKFVDIILLLFRNSIRSQYEMVNTMGDGWNIAIDYCGKWEGSDLPQHEKMLSLRDILNASWMHRLFNPEVEEKKIREDIGPMIIKRNM